MMKLKLRKAQGILGKLGDKEEKQHKNSKRKTLNQTRTLSRNKMKRNKRKL